MEESGQHNSRSGLRPFLHTYRIMGNHFFLGFFLCIILILKDLKGVTFHDDALTMIPFYPRILLLRLFFLRFFFLRFFPIEFIMSGLQGNHRNLLLRSRFHPLTPGSDRLGNVRFVQVMRLVSLIIQRIIPGQLLKRPGFHDDQFIPLVSLPAPFLVVNIISISIHEQEIPIFGGCTKMSSNICIPI